MAEISRIRSSFKKLGCKFISSTIKMENLIYNLKRDFCINEDLTDIQFVRIKKDNYDGLDEEIFGQKLCSVYTVSFSTFNLVYNMKILAFIYENSCEVLKLNLKIMDTSLEKEFLIFRNFLHRHRNLNSAFLILKKFARFCEARRLIVNVVLKKEPRINLRRNDDGAVCVKYICEQQKIIIEVIWKVEWDLKNCDVLDLIEVYYNNFVLPNSSLIKDDLEALTHYSLEFSLKLKLWKQLLADLSKYTRPMVITSESGLLGRLDTIDIDQTDTIVVISDSEDDQNPNEGSGQANKKKKRIENVSQVINVCD